LAVARNILRMIRILALLGALFAAVPFESGEAAPVRTAVFDMEFRDTSLQGQVSGLNAGEQQRLAMLTMRLRDALAGSGRYDVVDIGPVREAALASNLQNCGGCERRLASELGAELAVTGVVQKVSNLILNINIYVRDVATGKLVEGYSADIRSNTDESWLRGLNWILKNRLLAEKRP
jgi:hypothetical protein